MDADSCGQGQVPRQCPAQGDHRQHPVPGRLEDDMKQQCRGDGSDFHPHKGWHRDADCDQPCRYGYIVTSQPGHGPVRSGSEPAFGPATGGPVWTGPSCPASSFSRTGPKGSWLGQAFEDREDRCHYFCQLLFRS